MDSVDIVDENPNYNVDNSSDDDSDKCDLCKEIFGDGQESSTLACGHVLHASCVNKIPDESSRCPVCEGLTQMFCQQMKIFKSRMTSLMTNTKDVESRAISHLENYAMPMRLDFDIKMKHLKSKFAKLRSTLAKFESVLDSCPVCKGMSSNTHKQLQRIETKLAKIKATEAEVEITVMELTSTLEVFGCVAAA